MAVCFFATDLHGQRDRYDSLFSLVEKERPRAVFLGGDLTPHAWAEDTDEADFVGGFLANRFQDLQGRMGSAYPAVFCIPGNDDYRTAEKSFEEVDARGTWHYMHARWARLGDWHVFGYACVPPTPFQLKDWEQYDVSRYVPPGAVSPETGTRSVPVPTNRIRYGSISKDLETLTQGRDLERTLCLFHAPPHETNLDRAALDGKMVDYVPLDVNVGSIAIRRFIETRQPRLTLHGHIHESARLTGSWRDTLGDTHCFGGAHDGPELALVRFDPEDPASATRSLH